MVHVITNNDFSEVNKKETAVVDFFATWCGPCKMLAPVFHELAEEMEKEIPFFKADVDENGELAQQFGVTSVPTVVVLKNGKESARNTGFMTKADLASWIRGQM